MPVISRFIRVHVVVYQEESLTLKGKRRGLW